MASGAGKLVLRILLCAAPDFTERLIRACAELPKMCEFFHVPFQSGDNDILREMKCASLPLRLCSGLLL